MEWPPPGFFYNSRGELESLPEQRRHESREDWLQRCLDDVIGEGFGLAQSVERLLSEEHKRERDGKKRSAARAAWKMVQLTDKWPGNKGAMKGLVLSVRKVLAKVGAPAEYRRRWAKQILDAMTPRKTGPRQRPLARAKRAYNVLTGQGDTKNRSVRGPLKVLLLETKPSTVTL